MMSKLNMSWACGSREWERSVDRLEALWRITKDGVKRAMRRRVKPRFWLIMIAVTLVVFGASMAVMRVRYAQGEQRLAKAEAEKGEMALQVSLLSDELDFAQTDDFVIRMARDELGMIMPGEIRYVNGAR